MSAQEIIDQAERQKWFDFLSTLRPYLNKKQDSPIFQLNAILNAFIIEAEQSINLIPNEAIRQDKRAKLGKLYEAYNLATQSMGIQVILEQKNLRQQIRLNEVENLLIELADENRILKAKLDWQPE